MRRKHKVEKRETAAQAMARLNTQVLQLIEDLKEHVRVNNEKFETSGRKDWGYAGNLSDVKVHLNLALGLNEFGQKED